jgi:ribosomal protein S18 acetylase RimI-like enzyme
MKTHTLSARDKEALDRPIWSSLTSKHRSLAWGEGQARRYPPAIAPFAAVSEFTPGAVAELRSLATAGPVALQSSTVLGPLLGLEVQSRSTLRQMILMDGVPDLPDSTPETLAAGDVPAMLELTALTKPGPFFPQTYQLGRYIGIRYGDRLVAMAGERLRLDGYTEISAVCVHPDYRGKGYARILMKSLAKTITGGGEIPMLHVLDDNRGAIALYERLGFVTRAMFQLTVMHRSEAMD